MNHPFGTLSTAMVTPFKPDGSVDYDAAASLANTLVDGGCDSLVVTGTTGETSTLTDQENLEMFRVVKEAVGDRAGIIAGAGTNDTRHSMELARKAEEVGVDGLLIVTPYYNKPSQAGVYEHFTSIANATGLPVMLYDIPGRTGIPIATETIIRLAEHPRITALKDAKADFGAVTQVLAGTDLLVYSGDDGLTLPWMAAGAQGVVSVTAHIATKQFRALVDAVRSEDLTTARALNLELDPVIRAVMTHLQGAVAAKHILYRQGVIPHATVRLPLVEPTPEELEPLRADLAASTNPELRGIFHD